MPLLQKAEAQGLRVDTLRLRPRLPESLSLAVRCYADLAHDLSPLGRIPFVAIKAWADATGADTFWLLDRVRAIEEAAGDGAR